MGYFMLFESMLDTVLWARDQYLIPDGTMLPNFCLLFMVGVNDPNMHDAHIGYVALANWLQLCRAMSPRLYRPHMPIN